MEVSRSGPVLADVLSMHVQPQLAYRVSKQGQGSTGWVGSGLLPCLVRVGPLLRDPPADHGAPIEHSAGVVVLAEVHCAGHTRHRLPPAADPYPAADRPHAAHVGLILAAGNCRCVATPDGKCL